jgi:hypothetical protein
MISSPDARFTTLAADTGFARARDGYLITRVTVIRPATAADPGQYQTETLPASSFDPGAYEHWLDHVWPAAACTRPIRLHGNIQHVDPATGELLRAIPTDEMPDRAVYKPCGNRRATTCPGCADTYRRDAFHLIRAGLTGGKGVPDTVARHPAVFATFTAPSFGPVHARLVRNCTCARRDQCRCRAEPCHARRDAGTCPHGRPAACYRRHRPGDARLGQPLCPDCYDYNAHVVWNASAGELWRRTKQDIERHLIGLAVLRGHGFTTDGRPPVRVSHGKVAEYQARGAVHFHVLFRLDGAHRRDKDRIVPPPPGITAADLEHAVRHSAAIAWTTADHPANPGGWTVGWGAELDVRTVAVRGDGTVTDLAVASYLAKYATKGTETAGHASARLTSDTIDLYAKADGTHPERLIHACWTLGTDPGYVGLRRWAHMLGFGGHFLTKARRYSVTLTALRQARITYRRSHDDTGPEHGPLDRQDDTGSGTVLVLNRLSYVGTGWHTTGDALLASTAADQARKRRETGREELASEYVGKAA